jgi:hypothetical protein
MKSQISQPHGKISALKIQELEASIGYPLPNDYRNFLLACNGGRTEEGIFDYKLPDGRTWTGGVREFLGFDLEYQKNIEFFLTMRGERVPANTIPIATDEGGNFIVLSFIGEDTGKVYFWDHNEETEVDSQPTYENMYFIANSFTDFLNCLRPLSEEELAYVEKQAATAKVE